MLALIGFAFVSSITPGPNNMMLMASGVNHGVRKSMPHFWGICLGFPLMLVVVACGIFAALSAYPIFYTAIKFSGIAYLFFLAWKIANTNNLSSSKSVRDPLSFLQAVGFQWLNPKAWAMATGALTAFSLKEQYAQSVIAIVVTYIVSGVACMSFWLMLGHNVKALLNTSRKVRIFNCFLALILVATVVPTVYEFLNSKFL